MRRLVLLVSAILLAPGPVAAGGLEADVLRHPTRITAGPANRYMGVLSPDGHHLYYASDARATSGLYRFDQRTGSERLLFELDADATYPRLSPDGRHLLFVSYRQNATGDVCVMDLGRETHRCLTDSTTADVQAVWLDGGAAVGVVQRSGLHADFVLRRVPLSGGRGEVLIDHNLSAPAASPDGRFIAYIPLERGTADVGVTFSMRLGEGITLFRLADGASYTYRPPLPGISGFPAFSEDGRYLYFSQYLNDTNFDGVVDGNDHSVLFRVPLDPDSQPPIAAASAPEQLTSAAWNCQYPSPAGDRLVMTCAHEGSLDIYALSLEGSVPRSWSHERLAGELAASRDHWEKLLLLARIELLASSEEQRLARLRLMMFLHTELKEYESAQFYAGVLRQEEAPTAERREAAEWARVMSELVAHRREKARLAAGRFGDRFLAGERDRIRRLGDFEHRSPSVVALADVVLSEVLDVLGDKGAARAAFERVNVDEIDDALVLRTVGEVGRRHYRLHNEHAGARELLRTLSEHDALEVEERLFFADKFVAELIRGRGRAEQKRLIAKQREWNPGNELELRLALESFLLRLGHDDSEELREGIFELYRGARDVTRRKLLVLTTASRAAALDEDYILYEFANSWVSWLKRAHPERRYAEKLYRQVALERAYSMLAREDYSDARGVFYGTTLLTDSLAAHIGFIEARFREGRDEESLRAEYAARYRQQPENPVHAFVRAYLIARRLPEAEDTQIHERWAALAIARLRSAASSFPHSHEVFLLWGYIAHQQFLRTGDSEAAMVAHTRYLLALDLARTEPRARAALHLALGVLQGSLGNHSIAARHFAARGRYQFLAPARRLAWRLAYARSLFHLDRDGEAADEAERALALSTGELERYRPLALDRAALYSHSAGRYARARELYQELEPLIDSGCPTVGSLANRVKVRLGHGAAALGEGAYDHAARELAAARALLEGTREPFRKASTAAGFQGKLYRSLLDEMFSREDYASLLAAMEAHALRGLGRLDEATAAMERRRDHVSDRFARFGLDEDLLELAVASYHLAEYAYRQEAMERALAHVEFGLERAREFGERTGTLMTPVRSRLLAAYAELHLFGKVPVERFALGLRTELDKAHEHMARYPSPAQAADRFLLGLYLTMLETDRTGEPK